MQGDRPDRDMASSHHPARGVQSPCGLEEGLSPGETALGDTGGSRGARGPPLDHTHIYTELCSLQPPSHPLTLTSESHHYQVTSCVFQTECRDLSTGQHRTRAKPGSWGQCATTASQDGVRSLGGGRSMGSLPHRSMPQFPLM